MGIRTGRRHRSRIRNQEDGTFSPLLVTLAASLLVGVAASSGYAAPQEPTATSRAPASAPPMTPLHGAQQAFDAVKARYTAGIATGEEMEQATAALAIAQATARLQEARVARERQKRLVTAGLASTNSLGASELTVTEKEVALNQAQADQWQQATARLQAQLRAGLIARADVTAATAKREAAQAQLTTAKARFTAQKLALLKAHLVQQQTLLKAGVGSQAAVEKAQSDYDAYIAVSAAGTTGTPSTDRK